MIASASLREPANSARGEHKEGPGMMWSRCQL
jgi:hypothetical protein